MKRSKVLRIAGWIFVVLIALLAIGITATIGWRPFIGPNARALTDRRFDSTPERLARGRYITENVANCFACHSDREWNKTDAPEVTGTHGAGAPIFPLEGLPGAVHPPNITPDKDTGAGNWTDDQLARAIREGIGYDGRALFPMMPYENFRFLSDEDLASVIVYLRSIPPVRREIPKTELIFPVKYLIRSAPHPVTEPVSAPDVSTPQKRGDYLVTIGGCRDCHTPLRDGQRLTQFDLAGGDFLRGPWGDATSANITQSPSGIPYYDDALFLEVMRTGMVKARQLKQIMPWWYYRNMTDEDLKSIFAYLRTVPQIQHRVDNSKPPSPCRLCGLTHNGGDLN
jgi:mono/diheme cytochrome c family protein